MQDAARSRRAATSSSKVTKWLSGGEVAETDIAAVISSWTGIPLTKLVESERDNLLRLGDELHRCGGEVADRGAESAFGGGLACACAPACASAPRGRAAQVWRVGRGRVPVPEVGGLGG